MTIPQFKTIDDIEHDKIFKVVLPINKIGPEGQTAIREFLNSEELPSLPNDWSWDWVVQKGQYAGTLPKRVNKFYRKEHGIKVTTEILSQIGNIANQHTLGKIMVLNDDTNGQIDVYGVIESNGVVGSWGASQNATHILLQYTSTATDTTVKASRQLLVV